MNSRLIWPVTLQAGLHRQHDDMEAAGVRSYHLEKETLAQEIQLVSQGPGFGNREGMMLIEVLSG